MPSVFVLNVDYPCHALDHHENNDASYAWSWKSAPNWQISLISGELQVGCCR